MARRDDKTRMAPLRVRNDVIVVDIGARLNGVPNVRPFRVAMNPVAPAPMQSLVAYIRRTYYAHVRVMDWTRKTVGACVRIANPGKV